MNALAGLGCFVLITVGAYTTVRWIARGIVRGARSAWRVVMATVAPAVRWWGRRAAFASKVRATQARDIERLDATSQATIVQLLGELLAENRALRGTSSSVPSSNAIVVVAPHSTEN